MSGQIKNASIVSIGNEVLSGRTVDTNAAHLGHQLRLIGLPVVSSYTVGDCRKAIVRALTLAAEDADIVIATGGLGPTDDDLTRQAFADLLGEELEFREGLWEKIAGIFHSHNWKMPEKNRIQAYIPKGAKAVANDWGTAAGIAATKDGKRFFALPGVPGEMQKMLEVSVVPELTGLLQGQAVVVRRLNCFGAGESAIAEMLGDAMERGRNPLVNCTAHSGIIRLEIVATAESRDVAEVMAESEETLLRQLLGSLIYGLGDQTLAEVVGRKLAESGRTLAVAESCTGGLLAKMITDVPGASGYFTRGWITYSNEAKTEELGVPESLIAEHGAVSEEVAEAMAQGARRRAGTDYAIGITGIAGPGGGTDEKPCGLVYISIDGPDGTDTAGHTLFRDRKRVRLRAAQTALNTLSRLLEH